MPWIHLDEEEDGKVRISWGTNEPIIDGQLAEPRTDPEQGARLADIEYCNQLAAQLDRRQSAPRLPTYPTAQPQAKSPVTPALAFVVVCMIAAALILLGWGVGAF